MHYNALIISHFTGFWKQNCVKCPKTGVKNKKSSSGTGKGTLSLFVVLGQGLCYTGIVALLASCTGCGSLHLLRALGGTRILQAAAPTAPPCIPPFVTCGDIFPRRGGSLCSLAAVVAVAAEVAAYYLCKWLDSLMCKGSKH